ncbi:GTPase ObgE [Chondromyces apiculatus]|uniref:GTPase Obg n=1 Tax=Chondromyces apiculatus DSM 436 TaxID=1192034 RepID=A0A017TGJ1_9BACT|nr:GTPase ObgE [Chondromyces apiculatus]EYF08413.1 GTP-binding protein Obg [Chondromyces apiculatus DSM 436]
MRFVDQCRLKVVAGDGGNGAAAFRREKFVPFGGPSGGDGGRGGHVTFVGDEGLSTLLDFTYMRTIEAKRGEHGQGSDCYGRAGADRIVRIPVGTEIRDAETGEMLADITRHGQELIVARGGKGGRGNIHFATPFDRAPRRAEKGEAGEKRELLMELKVLADIGLLGFPNVGKSTFVSAVSAARPKIADYPFTTLNPILGMVEVGGGPRGGGTSFVIADIPGLIPGASEGIGLGIQFLKHVERSRALLHLVTLDHGEGREPLADYRALRKELKRFSPELAERPELVALSKADLPEVRDAYPALARRFAKAGVKLSLVSAATHEGLSALVAQLAELATKAPRAPAASPPPPEPSPELGQLLAEGEGAPSSAATAKKAKSSAAARKPASRKAAPAAKKASKKAAPAAKKASKKAAPAAKKASKNAAPAAKKASKKAAPAAKKASKTASRKTASRKATKPASRKTASRKATKPASRKTASRKATKPASRKSPR